MIADAEEDVVPGAAEHHDDVCGTCGLGGWLFQCVNHEDCQSQHHFHCLGMPFPFLLEVDYVCAPCGGELPVQPAPSSCNTFECIICMERKPEREKVGVVGCTHAEHVCSKCMFVEIYNHGRDRCPLCRREVKAVEQVSTGQKHLVEDAKVEAAPLAEGEEESESQSGEEGEEGEQEAVWSLETAIDLMRRNDPFAASVIDLDRMHLDNNDAKLLADALKANRTILVLSLNGNQVGSRGAKALAEALRANSTLLRLHLDGNELNDRAMSWLASCIGLLPGTNRTLRLLTLHENHRISKKGVNELEEACEARSNLRVLYPWVAEEESDDEEAQLRHRERKRKRRREERARLADMAREEEEEDEEGAYERERNEVHADQLNHLFRR